MASCGGGFVIHVVTGRKRGRVTEATKIKKALGTAQKGDGGSVVQGKIGGSVMHDADQYLRTCKGFNQGGEITVHGIHLFLYLLGAGIALSFRDSQIDCPGFRVCFHTCSIPLSD
jgi:hypothetical protein